MKLKPIILALALTGCNLSACGFTPQGDAIRNAVKVYGAQAYDEGLENSLFFMCKVASKGSVDRKFGTSQNLADSYNELCGNVEINIIDMSPEAAPEAAPLEQPP